MVIDWIVLQEPEPTEAEPEAEKPGAGCLWVWGRVRAGPTGKSPQRLVWGLEQLLGTERPAGGRQSGRRPCEGSFLAVASLGGPGLGSVSAKAHGEQARGELFSSHSCSTT